MAEGGLALCVTAGVDAALAEGGIDPWDTESSCHIYNRLAAVIRLTDLLPARRKVAEM